MGGSGSSNVNNIAKKIREGITMLYHSLISKLLHHIMHIWSVMTISQLIGTIPTCHNTSYKMGKNTKFKVDLLDGNNHHSRIGTLICPFVAMHGRLGKAICRGYTTRKVWPEQQKFNIFMLF